MLASACIMASVPVVPLAMAVESISTTPLELSSVDNDNTQGEFSQPRWVTELPYPIVKVLAGANGTTYAIVLDETGGRVGIYGISNSGQVENNGEFIDLKGQKLFLSIPGLQPIVHSDGNIYLPLNVGSPSMATLYQINPDNGYETRIVFQQGYANRSNENQWNKILTYKFGKKNLYIGTGESTQDGHAFIDGIIYAVDIENTDPHAFLWKEKMHSPVDRILISPTEDKIAVYNNEWYGVSIFDSHGKFLSKKSHHLFPEANSFAVDNHGNIYLANLLGPSLSKTSLFAADAKVLWHATTEQQQANFANRFISLGERNEVYMAFFNHVYAINRDNGDNLFTITAPYYTDTNNSANSNRFLNSGSVVTDPVSGWGYLSYLQHVPTPLVGVLGFSPDGKKQQRLFEINENLAHQGGSAVAGFDIEMSEPVIFKDSIYFSAGKKVYALPLNQEATESDVVITGLKNTYQLDAEGKFNFTFDIKTPEVSVINAKLHCDGVALSECSGPNVVSTALTQAGEFTELSMNYLHPLKAKPGKYTLSVTSRTRSGDETQRDFIITLR